MKQVRFWRSREPQQPVKPFPQQDVNLYSDVEQNMQVLRSMYTDCEDIVFRSFAIGVTTKAYLVYIEGLSNKEEIDKNVLTPLMHESVVSLNDLLDGERIPVSDVKEIKTFGECIEQISIGNSVLLLDTEDRGISLALAKFEKRRIEEPVAESVVRGPREGFTESIVVNMSLLRRRIKSPALKMKSLKIGRYTQTKVVVAYVEGIVDQTLVEEVMNRLKRIDYQGVFNSGEIEEFIEDNPFSPFPSLLDTERVDVVTYSLLEGRVAILTDGSPTVLVAPTSFFSLLQSPEDYHQRFLIGTAIRWLRFLFVGLSLLLPSLYVAILSYHQEMLPTTLLLTVAASREEVPFPAFVEAFLMEVTFEALREAGVRLPKQVGAAVSIVGALVIGQAAISAGLASSPMVMVVALTGIASFMIPRFTAGIALRMLRFPMIILAGTLGILGIMIGIIAIVVHVCSIRSFGVPYLQPIAPLKVRSILDTIVRAPVWAMDVRTHLTGEYNKFKESPGLKPGPEKGGD
ncbi:spore germination protein [Collibacillus ludicampi]|uniref:Spore germination protein n=1 Tax=Collibacillus ludicampi TaxID=2771369 RepID=A0AAV4LET6_9BACL|nr:spore germination protein [Collibacillus ludicampi]GIM46183.1 spore germination protein [Collibacillus ludicampi]